MQPAHHFVEALKGVRLPTVLPPLGDRAAVLLDQRPSGQADVGGGTCRIDIEGAGHGMNTGDAKPYTTNWNFSFSEIVLRSVVNNV